MKNQLKKESFSKFEGMKKEQMTKIIGGEAIVTSITKVVKVGITIVDDLNGLIR